MKVYSAILRQNSVENWYFENITESEDVSLYSLLERTQSYSTTDFDNIYALALFETKPQKNEELYVDIYPLSIIKKFKKGKEINS